jgi:hypothetical protein
MAKANLPPERRRYVADVLVLAILTVLLLTAAVTGLGVLYGDTTPEPVATTECPLFPSPDACDAQGCPDPGYC